MRTEIVSRCFHSQHNFDNRFSTMAWAVPLWLSVSIGEGTISVCQLYKTHVFTNEHSTTKFRLVGVGLDAVHLAQAHGAAFLSPPSSSSSFALLVVSEYAWDGGGYRKKTASQQTAITAAGRATDLSQGPPRDHAHPGLGCRMLTCPARWLGEDISCRRRRSGH